MFLCKIFKDIIQRKCKSTHESKTWIKSDNLTFSKVDTQDKCHQGAPSATEPLKFEGACSG